MDNMQDIELNFFEDGRTYTVKGLNGHRCLNTDQAARYCNMTTGYMRIMRSNKLGPRYIKFEKKVLYRIEDLEKWLKEHLV